jgi:hypothetical protein
MGDFNNVSAASIKERWKMRRSAKADDTLCGTALAQIRDGASIGSIIPFQASIRV